MSSTEPPTGSTPPPGGEPTPPPPTSTPPPASTPPPMDTGTAPPPPPPPAANYGTPSPPTPAAGMGAAPVPAATGAGQPGSLLDRFLARLIDFVILFVIAAIINVILAVVFDSFLLTTALSAVITAVLYVGYFAYMESNRGQTIGKQVMKLRTFGPDGSSNPTMEQAVRRNIWLGFGILGVIPVLGSLIGGLAELAAIIMIAVGINSDPRRQHWFDKFASGTQVMKVG
jgi:uncharacterized RDD family membrane protein YckC